VIIVGTFPQICGMRDRVMIAKYSSSVVTSAGMVVSGPIWVNVVQDVANGSVVFVAHGMETLDRRVR